MRGRLGNNLSISPFWVVRSEPPFVFCRGVYAVKQNIEQSMSLAYAIVNMVTKYFTTEGTEITEKILRINPLRTLCSMV